MAEAMQTARNTGALIPQHAAALACGPQLRDPPRLKTLPRVQPQMGETARLYLHHNVMNVQRCSTGASRPMLPRDKNIGSVHRHVYALRGDRVPHLRNMSLAPAPPAAFCDAEGCTAHLLAADSAVANRRVLSSFLVLKYRSGQICIQYSCTKNDFFPCSISILIFAATIIGLRSARSCRGRQCCCPMRPAPCPGAARHCAWQGRSYRPSGHEWRPTRILLEVYSPRMLASKLLPTVFLRASKALALLVNEAVGRWLFGWRRDESRLLDFVGKETKALCFRVYEEEAGEAFVRAFLVRRFTFCVLTSIGTIAQLLLQLNGQPSLYPALISVALAPVTIIDRQFATLVTKLIPRHDRSLLFQLCQGIANALHKAFPDVPTLTLPRAAGSNDGLCNLTL